MGINRLILLVFIYMGKSNEKIYIIIVNNNQFNAILINMINSSYDFLKSNIGPYFSLYPKIIAKSLTESP